MTVSRLEEELDLERTQLRGVLDELQNGTEVEIIISSGRSFRGYLDVVDVGVVRLDHHSDESTLVYIIRVMDIVAVSFNDS